MKFHSEYPPVEPPTEEELDREYLRSLIPPPLVLPEEDVPAVLTKEEM